ncbi:MAG: isoprenyl transferase [Alphaproteobacteria bacterium]|nr:isoprenyl transferase [Alphaproteobacteria bacterium]
MQSTKEASHIPPAHVAIIMDGNGRWAKARNLPRTVGHKNGVKAVKVAIENACEIGVSYLTLFGFSSENWNRSDEEVNALMGLFRVYLNSEISKLHDNGIRVRFIGERSKLADDIVNLIEKAEEKTCNNKAMTLIVALSYSGRDEIVEASKRIASDVVKGQIKLSDITEETFASRLFTADIPDPDILIRTSGEQRISNFLLWQLAYTELIYTDTLWPDFSKTDFENAINEYYKRDRRYGLVKNNETKRKLESTC